MKNMDTALILVAFDLVSCQKKVPEQAAKKDMSFYPLWREISLTKRRTKIQKWSSAQHQRRVAEWAYTFTLDWNDWTNNIVGRFNQRPTINHRLRLGKSSFV